MDCSLPGSSLHGILQARILEWVAISFSRGSSQLRDQTLVFHIPGRGFNLWATREVICICYTFCNCPTRRHRQVASVVSNSVRPHGLQPTRLLRPWDSPDKNTGVGCHFLLQLSHGFCFFFLFFFLFAFQFGEFIRTYLHVQWFLPWPCPVYWWAHQRLSLFWYNGFHFSDFLWIFS